MSDDKGSEEAWILECLRSVRAELLFRIEHRDRWLKIDLLALTTLWALASGVKFGMESGKNLPQIVVLAPPVAFILCGLYYVEDGLIGQLNAYVRRLSNARRDLTAAGDLVIHHWDASAELRAYAEGKTLTYRVLVQLMAFVATPAYLATTYAPSPLAIVFEAVTLLGSLALVAIGSQHRKTTGGEKGEDTVFRKPAAASPAPDRADAADETRDAVDGS
ncbi:MAG: hypothetical protein AB7O37_16550 [Vicinamibacteria bacterium]